MNTVTQPEIEAFFNQYKKGLSTIKKLEHQLLKESYSFGKWFYVLKNKSTKIREIFQRNIVDYDHVIGSLLDNPDILNEELAATYLVHEDFFLSEGYRDYAVTVPVLRILYDYYCSYEDKGKVLDCAFFLALSLLNERKIDESIKYFSIALSQCNNASESPDVYHSFRLMCGGYYRLYAYSLCKEIDQKVFYDYYQTACYWIDNALSDELLPPFRKETGKSILRQMVLAYPQSVSLEKHAKIFQDEYVFQISLPAQSRYDIGMFASQHKQDYILGEIDKETYINNLLDLYNKNANKYKISFSYGQWNFITLFDDELPEQIFSPDKLFHMNPAFMFINNVVTELLELTDSIQLKTELFHHIYRYFLGLPIIDWSGTLDLHLVNILKRTMASYNDSEQIIAAVQNLFAHRQIQTAIHSQMVSRLCYLMANAIIDEKPELLIGFFGTNCVDDLIEKREEIVHFAILAGECHDIGKLLCSNVINQQGRKICDDEFLEIKQHPQWGYDLLICNEELSAFAEFALHHHDSYDGTFGYPLSKEHESHFKVFVDMISICDSIDAATDTLGRNYCSGKTFASVLRELIEQSCTRYSKELVEIIANSPKVMSDMTKLLGDDRGVVQYEVYHKFIMPDTHFIEDDEKLIRPMVESDIKPLSECLNIDCNILEEDFKKCQKFSYIIFDGHGTLYGTIMCDNIEDEVLEIKQIVIKKDSRLQGFGTLLIEHLEAEAHLENIHKIYMPEIHEGHYDKFGWTNGFTHCDRPKYLLKIV